MVRRNEEGDDVEDEVKERMKEVFKIMIMDKVNIMMKMKQGEMRE